MITDHPIDAVAHGDTEYMNDPALEIFQRQLRRFVGGGDCAYERALNDLYKKLFEQRLQQLRALRGAGL